MEVLAHEQGAEKCAKEFFNRLTSSRQLVNKDLQLGA